MHVRVPRSRSRRRPYGPLPAKEVRALGAVGSVPPRMASREHRDPDKPEALAQKKKNQDAWLTSES
jgi:hypothetical protein